MQFIQIEVVQPRDFLNIVEVKIKDLKKQVLNMVVNVIDSFYSNARIF